MGDKKTMKKTEKKERKKLGRLREENERLLTELADWRRTVMAHESMTDTEEVQQLKWAVQDLRMHAEQDACEIQRLKEQLALADEILASEPIMWLISGSDNDEVWRDTIMPAMLTYWESYGRD